jgi:ferredoxin
MPRVVADLRRCEGYANCVILDPERFELDPDNHVSILRAAMSDDERDLVEQAVQSCPTQALSIEP